MYTQLVYTKDQCSILLGVILDVLFGVTGSSCGSSKSIVAVAVVKRF